MKFTGPFGLEFESTNSVVEFQVPDGRTFFAVKLEDGTFLGQRWEGNERVYPIYKTKRAAKKVLDAYLLTATEAMSEPKDKTKGH